MSSRKDWMPQSDFCHQGKSTLALMCCMTHILTLSLFLKCYEHLGPSMSSTTSQRKQLRHRDYLAQGHWELNSYPYISWAHAVYHQSASYVSSQTCSPSSVSYYNLGQVTYVHKISVSSLVMCGLKKYQPHRHQINHLKLGNRQMRSLDSFGIMFPLQLWWERGTCVTYYGPAGHAVVYPTQQSIKLKIYICSNLW